MILGCLFWGAAVGSAITYWLMSAQLEVARRDRFSLMHASQGWVYKIDHTTGDTWYMVAGQQWKPVPAPESESRNVMRFNSEGKRIE